MISMGGWPASDSTMGGIERDVIGALLALRQMGTVHDYRQQFDVMISTPLGITADCASYEY